MPAPQYPCSMCEDVFITLIELQKHMLWHDEMSAKRAKKEKKPSKTEEMGLTREPTKEEIDQKLNIVLPHGRPHLSEMITPAPPTAEAVPVVKEPIHLVYKFTGTCPTCSSYVETIEVELEGKNAVSAYCVNCHKSLEQKLVIPINKQ